MPKMQLTDRKVRELPAPAKGQTIYWDTGLIGFGLLVGTRARSFIIQVKNRRKKIGAPPVMTVTAARARASSEMAKIQQAPERGPTLREALESYLAAFDARGKSPRSAANIRYEVERQFADWLPRRLESITRKECRERHAAIRGRYTANNAMRHFRAVFRQAMKVHEVLGICPTIGVLWNKESRVRTPIADLAEWRRRIDGFTEVKRDALLTGLYLGVRCGDLTGMAWANADLDAATVRFPTPKGGPDKAFTLPLPAQVVEILRRRRERNPMIFGQETPWVFPAWSRREAGRVVQINELRWDITRVDGVPIFGKRASCHRLRDSFARACTETKIGIYETKLLMNHALPGGDVTAGYLDLSVEYLREKIQAVADHLDRKMSVVVETEGQNAIHSK